MRKVEIHGNSWSVEILKSIQVHIANFLELHPRPSPRMVLRGLGIDTWFLISSSNHLSLYIEHQQLASEYFPTAWYSQRRTPTPSGCLIISDLFSSRTYDSSKDVIGPCLSNYALLGKNHVSFYRYRFSNWAKNRRTTGTSVLRLWDTCLFPVSEISTADFSRYFLFTREGLQVTSGLQEGRVKMMKTFYENLKGLIF